MQTANDTSSSGTVRSIKPAFWANPAFWARLRRFGESVLVVIGMAGGSAALGYYAATQIERTAHAVEIERLQAANKVAMDAVLKNVEKATANAATATASAASATAAIGDVAEKVDKAANKADQAARIAAAKAANPTVKPPTVAVQPEVVNQEIRRANDRLKERK